ncbi:MAG: MAF protein [Pseudohongiellaceae bacterium]|jgi:MAF protein
MTPIILASSSKYRHQLLSRLGLDFDSQSSDIDETPLPLENPENLVLRLAQQKAEEIAKTNPSHLIIASDQAASLNGTILGKPGSHQNAVAQLESCSGQKVTFYTSICLLNTKTGHKHVDAEAYHVYFRDLSYPQIERYVCAEQPYDCAGSFKMENLGICLFKKMEGSDPNSLIGLPLIKLIDMLSIEGVNIP